MPSTQTSLGLKLRTGIEKLRESFLGRGHDIVDEELLRQAWFGRVWVLQPACQHLSDVVILCCFYVMLIMMWLNAVQCGSTWFALFCSWLCRFTTCWMRCKKKPRWIFWDYIVPKAAALDRAAILHHREGTHKQSWILDCTDFSHVSFCRIFWITESEDVHVVVDLDVFTNKA